MKTTTKILTIPEINQLEANLKTQFPAFQQAHALYAYKLKDGAIIAYKTLKVVFQGETAQQYVQKQTITHAGSDEVGSGDYFGPLVVCALIYDENLATLENKLVDSKQLSDKQICQIAPQLMQKGKYALQILNNDKYNQLHQTMNLNALKANLHQHCYHLLIKKYQQNLPKLCVIDQFVDEKKYYQYLNNDYQINHLTFTTKAENQFPAVAGAAIIARYAFLESLEKMNKKYHFSFPKGAGNLVDEAILKFVNKFGKKELNNVAKIHFKNTNIID